VGERLRRCRQNAVIDASRGSRRSESKREYDEVRLAVESQRRLAFSYMIIIVCMVFLELYGVVVPGVFLVGD